MQTTGNDDQTAEATTTPEPPPRFKVRDYTPEELKVMAQQGWSVGFVKNSRNITKNSPADARETDKGETQG